MFTGIIEQMGTVKAIDPSAAGKRLLIDPGPWQHRAAAGDSIAVNGCCLTHAPQTGDTPQTDDAQTAASGARGGVRSELLAFDVITETLDKTNLGQLTIGDQVNLEASITATTSMSGHFVQGHIEGLGTVTGVEDADEDYRISVRVDRALLACIIPKGSVAIDGVSLTVADVNLQADAQAGGQTGGEVREATGSFTVALIPTTLDLTNMGRLKVGDTVNIETDMIARTVVHCLRHGLIDRSAGPAAGLAGGQGGGQDSGQSAIDLQTLRDAGFVE